MDVYISSVDVVLNVNECAYMCVCVTVVLTTFAVYSLRGGERVRECVCGAVCQSSDYSWRPG